MLRGKNLWQELAALGLILMNLSWMVPWYQAVTRASSTVPVSQVFLVLGTIFLIVYISGRVMISFRLKMKLQYGIVGALVIGSILLGVSTLLSSSNTEGLKSVLNNQALRNWDEVLAIVPGEISITVTVLFVWWRGISMSRERIGPFMVIKHFKQGVVLLLLYVVVIARLVGYSLPVWFHLLFLVSGLMTLGTARISVITVLRGGKWSPFNRRWLAEMATATLFTVGFASLIGAFLTGQMNRIAGWLKGIFYLLGLLVVSPIILLISLLSGLLANLGTSELIITPLATMPPGEATEDPLGGFPVVTEGVLSIIDWIPILKMILGWGLVILVVFFFVLGVRRAAILMARRRSEAEGDSTIYEGISGIGRLLREVLREEARKAAGGLSRRLSRGERLMAAARIRRIYVHLLNLSRDLGSPRPVSITPLEFLPSLEHAFAGLGEDLRVITEAYVGVRYGELPETKRQLDAVEKAWLRVRAYGEDRKRAIRSQKKST